MSSRFINSVLALAVAAFLPAAAWGSSEGDTVSILHAAGGTWQADDLVWTEYNGSWRVSTLATLIKLPSKRLDFGVAVRALCSEILLSLPKAPNGVGQNNVYRVAVNLRSKLPGDVRGNTFPFAIPVQVKNGACQFKEAGELYFYTYPAPLEDWEATKVLFNAESPAGREIVLHFRNGNPSFSRVLPFQKACIAFFADPSPALSEIKKIYELPDNLNGHSVMVAEYNQGGGNLSFKAGFDYERYEYKDGQFEMFEYLDGKCIPSLESIRK